MFETLFKGMKFKDTAEHDKFKLLFEEYMKNIPENFYKNQFDLAKSIGGEFSDWVKILSYSTFKYWKDEQIAIIASTKTDEALAGGNLENKEVLPILKLRQDILNDEKTAEKPPMVVLPESLFFSDDN